MKTPTWNEAYSAVVRWYEAQVKEWAEDFDKRIRAGEFLDVEGFTEAFEEETKNAECISYTGQAIGVLLASRNEGAYEEAFGARAPSYEAAALMAFLADIRERMLEEVPS